MRTYTATPIARWDATDNPLIVVKADDIAQKEGSDVVAFIIRCKPTDPVDTFDIAIASVPGDKYIITSKEIE